MMFLFARIEEYGKVDTLAEILEKIPGHEHSYNYNYPLSSSLFPAEEKS